MDEAETGRPPTFLEAKAELAGLGYSLAKVRESGEFRAAPRDGTPAEREAKAYYTDDISDAVATVRRETERRAEHEAGRQGETAGSAGHTAETWTAVVRLTPEQAAHVHTEAERVDGYAEARGGRPAEIGQEDGQTVLYVAFAAGDTNARGFVNYCNNVGLEASCPEIAGPERQGQPDEIDMALEGLAKPDTQPFDGYQGRVAPDYTDDSPLPELRGPLGEETPSGPLEIAKANGILAAAREAREQHEQDSAPPIPGVVAKEPQQAALPDVLARVKAAATPEQIVKATAAARTTRGDGDGWNRW